MLALALSLLLTQTDGGVELPVFTPRADAFGEYAARFPTAGPGANAFSIPRVQLGLDGSWYDASARVLLEGAYATTGGALIGISGDSVVVRMREAWGGYRFKFLEARFGLVPTLAIPELERGFRFRELTPDGLENTRLLAPADFGATLKATLPMGFGFVGAAVTNGEGYTSRELNDGKNVEITALIRPLALTRFPNLEVLALASFGTSGLPAIPTTRIGGGVQWSSLRLGLGATAFYARGLLLDPSREGMLVQGFVRGTLFDHLLLTARAQYFNRSLAGKDAVFEALAGVGGQVAFLEAFVAYVRTVTLFDARAALPGVDGNEVRVVIRARWPQWIP